MWYSGGEERVRELETKGKMKSETKLTEGIEPQHHRIIDLMIRHPEMTQKEVAKKMKYSAGHISS